MKGFGMERLRRRSKRLLIAAGGGIVLISGVIMIPYPGPGWLVVFAGLGILSTEFTWAQRVLDYAKSKYDGWQTWLRRQAVWLKVLVGCLTALVVIVTIWLLDGYGFIERLLHLHQTRLDSPIFH